MEIKPINIAEHAERVRVPRLQTLVLLMLVSILVAGAGFWAYEHVSLEPLLTRLTFLQIEEVKISSEWPLTPNTIKSWLPRLEGRNILFVQANRLLDSLKQRPWVSGVTLKKELPNRIFIDVTTKRAQAIMIAKGQAYWLDSQGQVIEKTSPSLHRALDLPVLSVDDADRAHWALADVIAGLDRFRKFLDAESTVSEVMLGPFPLFRVFLSHPRVEVDFNFQNWQSQLPVLALLLHNPPSSLGVIQRINLVLPKKAVVSSAVSN